MSTDAIVFIEDDRGLRPLSTAGGYRPVPISNGAGYLRMSGRRQRHALLLDIAMSPRGNLKILKGGARRWKRDGDGCL